MGVDKGSQNGVGQGGNAESHRAISQRRQRGGGRARGRAPPQRESGEQRSFEEPSEEAVEQHLAGAVKMEHEEEEEQEKEEEEEEDEEEEDDDDEEDDDGDGDGDDDDESESPAHSRYARHRSRTRAVRSTYGANNGGTAAGSRATGSSSGRPAASGPDTPLAREASSVETPPPGAASSTSPPPSSQPQAAATPTKRAKLTTHTSFDRAGTASPLASTTPTTTPQSTPAHATGTTDEEPVELEEYKSATSKPPRSGYVYFLTVKRRAVTKGNPRMTLPDVTKMVAGMWQSTPDKIKEHYNRAATRLKKEFYAKHPEIAEEERKKRVMRRNKRTGGSRRVSSVAASGKGRPRRQRPKASMDTTFDSQQGNGGEAQPAQRGRSEADDDDDDGDDITRTGVGSSPVVLVEDEDSQEQREDLFCSLCNQYFSSAHNKREHLNGRKHREMLQEYGELEVRMKVFTDDFVQFNRQRERQLRELTREIEDLEASNQSLVAELGRLQSVNRPLEFEARQLEQINEEMRASLVQLEAACRHADTSAVPELSCLKNASAEEALPLIEGIVERLEGKPRNDESTRKVLQALRAIADVDLAEVPPMPLATPLPPTQAPGSSDTQAPSSNAADTAGGGGGGGAAAAAASGSRQQHEERDQHSRQPQQPAPGHHLLSMYTAKELGLDADTQQRFEKPFSVSSQRSGFPLMPVQAAPQRSVEGTPPSTTVTPPTRAHLRYMRPSPIPSMLTAFPSASPTQRSAAPTPPQGEAQAAAQAATASFNTRHSTTAPDQHTSTSTSQRTHASLS